VDPGDSIGSIACYYGDLSPEAILAYNGLKPDASLNTGQVLQIP
jgi:LysM repeat protein